MVAYAAHEEDTGGYSGTEELTGGRVVLAEVTTKLLGKAHKEGGLGGLGPAQ